MDRPTGTYRTLTIAGETVRAFVPAPLPPSGPPLQLDAQTMEIHAETLGALGRLDVAAAMVPSPEWFNYGFVRKEALITSEIEGTEATLDDVVTFEATRQAARPEDVLEVCNYVDALTFARRQIASKGGLPLSTRLLCGAHKKLMRGGGARGADKAPGEIRRSQNWIGGSRPGNARFVPPPPELVPELMTDLERWIHAPDPLPPLIRIGLAHVQFETIHPFLDGNGRIGRLLIALLLEHWQLLDSPLLYISVAIRRRQSEYYARLAAVREPGDWEGWIQYFLECVREAANDGVAVARKMFVLTAKNRTSLLRARGVTISAVRLFDFLPSRPVITVPLAIDLLKVSKPTAMKAIAALVDSGVLKETTGKKRDRVYAYQAYLDVLTAT